MVLAELAVLTAPLTGGFANVTRLSSAQGLGRSAGLVGDSGGSELVLSGF